MSGNKMALDALTAIVEADDAQCLEQSHIEQARAAIAALQAEPQPDEADLRQLMGMNEAEIDAELLAAGISPDDAVKRADRAIKGALATVRAERRAIEYGDIVHKQVVAMRAAVVAAKLESPEVGIQWIANTLFGPGHYPDIEAARELGGAQALFDKESAELEAFRAAHPAPVAAQPSQAPVVQAVPENCGTGYCSCIECVVEPEAVQTEVRFKYESMKPIDGYDAIYAEYATTFGRYPDDFMSKVVRQTKEDLFMWWGAHREKIRAGLVLLAAQEDASSGATTQAVRMLTPEEPEKCYSLDEETFYDLGDLIDMLDEEQAKPGILVYEGESVSHTASHYARGAVAYLFERMGEQAFDDAGEHIGDWPDHAVKDDNSAEFEKLIYDWLDANVKVHFYTVKNVRQIALTADMLGDDDASRTIPPSGVIGDAA